MQKTPRHRGADPEDERSILDRCQRWFNVARQVIAEQVPQVPVLDLGGDEQYRA